MSQKSILEIAAETVETALAAELGGADRIELCANLRVGGVTPSQELRAAVRQRVRLPVFSMVRPRAGDFFYSDEEFQTMRQEIAEAKQQNMDGIVFGILNRNRSVDLYRTRELIELARPLPVTFHRAFDECANLLEALEEVIRAGAVRILTSGGAATVPEGLDAVGKLISAAQGRIIIIPGSGIHVDNVREIAKHTQAREFHSGLSNSLPYGTPDYAQFETEVRKLAEALADSN